MTGAKTIILELFLKKNSEIHRFRSWHFRDMNVTQMSQTRHENDRGENTVFHEKLRDLIIFAPAIFVTRM